MWHGTSSPAPVFRRALLGGLLLGVSAAAATVPPPRTFGFATEDYIIEMTVRFFAPYEGKRLAFRDVFDPRKEMCYLTDGAGAGACAEQFVGAVALATFSVRKLDGTAAAAFIHERVTLISQSQGLPARLPYSMSQKAEKGIVSDIQAFGYDQAPLSHAERLRARRESSRTWRLYRQELYVDRHTRPFAIVEWRHAVDRIDLVRVYAPPEREALRPRLAEAHLPR